MRKNAFYFMLKAPFVLEKKKRLDKKAVLNLKIYDVTDWTTNNCNTHVTQNPKK